MRRSKYTFCFLAYALIAMSPAVAQETGTAPVLGAGSGFQAGPAARLLERVRRLGIEDLRDGINWGHVEKEPGQYSFDLGGGKAISAVNETGILGSLTVYPGNPLYEDGDTLITDEGIKAFAEFTSKVANNFPNLPRIEVGNEFNSTSFISGPAKKMAPLERAELYARYLAAIDAQPGMKDRYILGGATHSIAAGYIWKLLDAGAGAHMDGVALHPYTTMPEQIPREIAVLRRHPEMAGLDVEITEFGTTDWYDAADFFWRNYCSMAVANVSRAVWYSLGQRGDRTASILARDLSVTAVGRAFLFAHKDLGGKPFQEFRPDPFTYGCLFDGNTAVIWGAPREFSLTRDDISVRSANLRPYDGPLTLSRNRVLVLRSEDAPINLYEDVILKPNNMLADSFDQFNLPPAGQTARDGDSFGFDHFLRVAGRELPLSTCPGQQAPRTPWRPYLCNETLRGFVLQPSGFWLGGNADRPVTLVSRHTLAEAAQVQVEVAIGTHQISKDGVGVTLVMDGQEVERRTVTNFETLTFAPLTAAQGAVIDIVIDPNDTPTGDVGRLRITLRDVSAAISPLQ